MITPKGGEYIDVFLSILCKSLETMGVRTPPPHTQFSTEFQHVTANTLVQGQRVKGQGHSVTFVQSTSSRGFATASSIHKQSI